MYYCNLSQLLPVMGWTIKRGLSWETQSFSLRSGGVILLGVRSFFTQGEWVVNGVLGTPTKRKSIVWGVVGILCDVH